MAKTSLIIKNNRIKAHGHPTKAINRCNRCGRPRGFIRFFGLCRICFRNAAHKGELPGVTKASK
jgi:small subunit ribosomal protein S14